MKADLHIHTSYSSDIISSPKEVVKTAILRGINCICITDHGEIKGAIEVLKAGFDQDILVIPGIEIKSKLGHVLGINIKKIIPNGLSLKETVKEIRKQGGMAVIPHPFAWPARAFLGKEKDLLLAEAIEIFNATLFSFSNKKALSFVQKHDLPFTAGPDAHSTEFIGKAFIEMTKKNPLSPEEVLEEIRNKRVKVGGKTFTPLGLLKNYFKMEFKKLAKNGFGTKKRKI
jgi:predicted metal-dependent phosphoesterase TrpH